MIDDEHRAAHLLLFLSIAEDRDVMARVRRAAEAVDRVQAEELDLTTLRREAIWQAHADGATYPQLASATGLTEGRIGQLVRESRDRGAHPADVRHIANIKRRARRLTEG